VGGGGGGGGGAFNKKRKEGENIEEKVSVVGKPWWVPCGCMGCHKQVKRGDSIHIHKFWGGNLNGGGV